MHKTPVLGRCPDCWKVFYRDGNSERELLVDEEIVALSLAHGSPTDVRCEKCFDDYIDSLVIGGPGISSKTTLEEH